MKQTERQKRPRLADGYPRVFVSYAQESRAHKNEVLAFAERLHEQGIGVVLDQDAPDHRADWQLWATRNILAADFVLVVASAECRRAGDGDLGSSQRRGLQAEMRTLRDLYSSDHGRWVDRILPVVLPGQAIDGIPLFLQPCNADHYVVEPSDGPGFHTLLRVIRAGDSGGVS